MAKTRLTKADREAIRDAVIEHKFAPLDAANAAEEAALAVKARIKAYGSYLPTIEAAPAGAYAEQSVAPVNVGGKRISLYFDGAARLFAKSFGYGNFLLSLSEDDAFGKAILDHAERKKTLRADRSKLEDIVNGTLSAFNTFDDLLAGWPEAESFITARWRERPDYSANVPAVAIRDLSAALDLPPDVAEAA